MASSCDCQGNSGTDAQANLWSAWIDPLLAPSWLRKSSEGFSAQCWARETQVGFLTALIEDSHFVISDGPLWLFVPDQNCKKISLMSWARSWVAASQQGSAEFKDCSSFSASRGGRETLTSCLCPPRRFKG